MDRFAWQRSQVELAEEPILDVGAYDDPAGLYTLGKRVEKADINPLWSPDHLMDMREPWPFEDDSYGMVMIGGVLEHFVWPDEVYHVLREARRVAPVVCIDTPMDDRPTTHYREPAPDGDRGHVTAFDQGMLRKALDETGWEVEEFLVVDYVFVPEGYLIRARRRDG